jgi:hypothetical protein
MTNCLITPSFTPGSVKTTLAPITTPTDPENVSHHHWHSGRNTH